MLAPRNSNVDAVFVIEKSCHLIYIKMIEQILHYNEWKSLLHLDVGQLKLLRLIKSSALRLEGNGYDHIV